MPVKLPIYMDNNATTPLDPRVLEAMMPYLTTEFGNAASRSHPFGWKAEEAVDQARAEIGKVCREKGVLFHCDAVQGVGKVPFDVEKDFVDIASLSGHKIYGPKGIGALYVRRKPRVRIAPIIDGGGHERGMRSGTLNVPGIVGFGKASELCQQLLPEESHRTYTLRRRLQDYLFSHLDHLELNGHPTERLPGNLNVSFAYVEGEALMMAIKEAAVSSGSACTSASLEPSYVLRACGISEDLAHTSIRFGVGRFNTEAEVDFDMKYVVEQVAKLREWSYLDELAKARIVLSMYVRAAY